MDERFLPFGTYTVIVPTPEVRVIAGDDPEMLWADVFAPGICNLLRPVRAWGSRRR